MNMPACPASTLKFPVIVDRITIALDNKDYCSSRYYLSDTKTMAGIT
tara:strand:- start:5285 stop:5425 length:141 start_codon:yes stop_codon:yes gene_type:complete